SFRSMCPSACAKGILSDQKRCAGCFRFAVSNSIALCGVNASEENAGFEITLTKAHSVKGHVAQPFWAYLSNHLWATAWETCVGQANAIRTFASSRKPAIMAGPRVSA